MNYPPFMFHPINSITAYKGQIIYDTPATEAKAQTPVPYLQWQTAPGVTPPQLPADRPEFADGAARAGRRRRRHTPAARRRRRPTRCTGCAAARAPLPRRGRG